MAPHALLIFPCLFAVFGKESARERKQKGLLVWTLEREMGMEKNVGTTSSSMQNAEERGAGGKLRRPTPRRPPATPYARPQQNQSQRSGWLSKVVDPACRLIAGGAARMFPYLFSNSPDIRALPALDIEKQDHG